MRKEKPTAEEIVEKAKRIRLHEKGTAYGKKDGKGAKFTPADTSHIKTLDEFEEGQVIGVLENEFEGDETGLPVGKHNMYLANVGGDWHVYAESGGSIVAEAVRVDVEYHKVGDRKSTKPTFNPHGWCFCVCV
ncbi:MAG: hypothetical protein V3V99_01640, partial [candidate division Zixibacteria bacterium]